MMVCEMLRIIEYHASGVLGDLSPDADLLINPMRLILWIGWAYLCFYSAQKIQFNPYVPAKYRTLFVLATLAAGPFVFLGLVIKRAVSVSIKTGTGLWESLSQSVTELLSSMTLLSHRPRRTGQEIRLMDASGRNIRDIYGKSDKQARNILQLTESIVEKSIKTRASDILIDPRPDSIYTIRFRIDGMLSTYKELDAEKALAVVNSFKAISDMDIAERRRPQDGSFLARVNTLNVSFRVASAGVMNGEKLSIRILNQNAASQTLDDVGLTHKQLQILRDAIGKPSGLILICGPTGSGKTSTLYAMLNEIDRFTRNVVTVEDPIETVLSNASQIEVNTKADITFAKALRSILRQDPDVICVGEIRDEETAEIALRAAQTGHQVFATLHCDSNTAAILRLLDLGVSPALLASGLQIIVSQRLVRCLCDHCKEPAQFTSTQTKDLMMKNIDPKTLFTSKGCKKCHETGYYGRTAIADITMMTPEFRASIAKNKNVMEDLTNQGAKVGTSNLKKQGLKKAVSGITTLSELKRVMG
ncbi:MAG: GspE/PulE family protein [Phycisphaerae bacterium]|nr:GspE/PulE family protein [Phycisphaerae bacterium]